MINKITTRVSDVSPPNYVSRIVAPPSRARRTSPNLQLAAANQSWIDVYPPAFCPISNPTQKSIESTGLRDHHSFKKFLSKTKSGEAPPPSIPILM
ncbi:hypothetical protein ISN44_As05g025420 [Arabidopsis suecica]|uniref:Uncharacterized protein n=1 Tax=Arabidopsis suecica TaxID=45249 RepID=A0A8T2DT93_ARASU|nr:hypothetical protein ISN44_As05g025420 [Arabidopsis suecica]